MKKRDEMVAEGRGIFGFLKVGNIITGLFADGNNTG